MLVEFSVVPLGKGESVSEYVAECVKIVRESGVKYLLTPMATLLEGEMQEVMDVIMKCHTKVMERSDRVITTVKIDDRKGRKNAMTQKIKSVEDKLV
jgi:uncharacterized protein (TIGR00106 family)